MNYRKIVSELAQLLRTSAARKCCALPHCFYTSYHMHFHFHLQLPMGPEKAFFEFSNDNKILSEAIIYDFTGNKTNVKKLINESDGK